MTGRSRGQYVAYYVVCNRCNIGAAVLKLQKSFGEKENLCLVSLVNFMFLGLFFETLHHLQMLVVVQS